MAKITYVEKKTTVDRSTGEETNTELTEVHKLPDEPPFVKLYLEDLIKLNDLPKSSSKVLYGLVKHLNYNSELIINAALKRIVAREIGLEVQSISNALTGFVKKNIMTRIDTGIYMINPELFAKGAWTDIRKLRSKYLELRVTYRDGKKEMHCSVSEVDS